MLPRRASDNVAQCLLILASRGPPLLADTPLISAFVENGPVGGDAAARLDVRVYLSAMNFPPTA
ncbi:hypothetical protein [Nocardia brasiliensis]|uniref:hypothetical protein n=1 Tax=Nocardia brasiliensis TaxID=37326 RepID=UPI0024569308|nr:hypothetical protein [Nocardia brasiliensis]